MSVRSLLALPFLFLFSCATMTTGTHEDIQVNSTPSGANATLTCSGVPAGEGRTPLTIRIHRNAGDCNLRLSMDDYEDATLLIEQGVNPAYWTNMLFAPLAPGGAYVVALGNSREKLIGAAMLGTAFIAIATDFRTGAAHMHRPQVVNAVLARKRAQ